MQDIKHENVIDLIEVHESQNSLYVVMELLEGGEIFSLSKGKLDNESTFSIVKHILLALVELDKNGVMHRDLKPDNIILKYKDTPIPENTLKLVDFGLATYQDVDEYLFKRCGTPGFVAPEVINAKKGANVHYSTKCDVFSVGIIFFFMLTGKIPYDGKDFESVLENNKKAKINFKIKELKKVNEIAFDLLKKMLELEPENRLTAVECLKHEYFHSKEGTLIMDDMEEDTNLAQNLAEFQNKYKGINRKGMNDSIHFQNPAINGRTDTVNSSMKMNSRGSNMSKGTDPGKIMSFHSAKGKKTGGGSSKGGAGGGKAQRESIYKYALMKGNNNVNLQKELEKMVNVSMDSYDSKAQGDESDSDSIGSEKSGSGKGKESMRQTGGKSRFAGR